MIKFKIGDNVRINPAGSFPRQGGGTIGKVTGTNTSKSLGLTVVWGNGDSDSYASTDLLRSYSKGDTVRCLKGFDTTDKSGGGGYIEGRVFTVHRISTASNGESVLWSGTGNGVYEKAVELANPDLKVGDLVKLTDYTKHEFPDYKGQIAEIIRTGKMIEARWKDGETSCLSVDGPDCFGAYKVHKNGRRIKADVVDKENIKPEKIEPIEAVELNKHDILGQDKIHKQLAIAVDLDMPVLIVGDTGTGKTTIVKSIADKYNADWIRFNLTGETTVDEFVGKYVLKNEETVWEDGVLLTAMKNGKWLIVDEVNVALPEILFVLHSLLDDDRSVMVSNHSGEVVKPHKNFRFFGTMNPVDEYAGTKDLNKAFKSRFGMILNMDYPSTRVETQIVQAKAGVKMLDASKIVDVGQALRKAKAENEIFYTCSTRDLIQWGSLVDKLGLQDAFTVSILNKANGDGEKVTQAFTKICGAYDMAKKAGDILNIEELAKINHQVKEERKSLEDDKGAIEKRVREKLLKTLMKDKVKA